jgi:hypothetical protein
MNAVERKSSPLPRLSAFNDQILRIFEGDGLAPCGRLFRQMADALLCKLEQDVEQLRNQAEWIMERCGSFQEILSEDPEIARRLRDLDTLGDEHRQRAREKVDLMLHQQKYADDMATGYDDHLCDLAAEINRTELAFTVTFSPAQGGQ